MVYFHVDIMILKMDERVNGVTKIHMPNTLPLYADILLFFYFKSTFFYCLKCDCVFLALGWISVVNWSCCNSLKFWVSSSWSFCSQTLYSVQLHAYTYLTVYLSIYFLMLLLYSLSLLHTKNTERYTYEHKKKIFFLCLSSFFTDQIAYPHGCM